MFDKIAHAFDSFMRSFTIETSHQQDELMMQAFTAGYLAGEKNANECSRAATFDRWIQPTRS